MKKVITPPIEYPTVTVGGVSYQIKFGLGAIYKMSVLGLEPGDLKAGSKLTFAKQLQLAVAGLGNFSGDDWVTSDMTPEQLADRLEPGELEAIRAALAVSAGKVTPAREASTEPAASGISLAS
jgi:hypothetical protein